MLGLLGRWIKLNEACVRFIIKQGHKESTHSSGCQLKLRMNIYDFEVLETQWDCQVPPKLTKIENDRLIGVLVKRKLVQH